jgi:hypothetical protein
MNLTQEQINYLRQNEDYLDENTKYLWFDCKGKIEQGISGGKSEIDLISLFNLGKIQLIKKIPTVPPRDESPEISMR